MTERVRLLWCVSLVVAVVAQEASVPDDVFMFVRPPVATPDKPIMETCTDSSLFLNFTYDPTTGDTKAVDVTNITTSTSLTVLTDGAYEITLGEEVGLNTTMTDYLDLHSIFETYLMKQLPLSLPLYTTIPNGKQRVFLRKPVKRFEVQLKAEKRNDDEVPQWETMVTLDVGQRRCEVEGLHPGLKYMVRVCSANSAGTGSCSAVEEMETADVPSKPGQIRMSNDGPWPTSLQLVVLKPVYTNGAELTDITLETSQRQHGPWTRVPYDMAIAKKLITNLEPGGLYFFRSRAWNKVGPSQWSDPVQFETKSMVPKRPENVKLLTQSAEVVTATTDVVIGWNPSDPRGKPVHDYEIQKALGYDTSEENYQFDSLVETTNATIEGLRAGKMYNIRVRANNAIGQSHWSDTIIVVAAPAVTLAPGPVELKEGGSEEIVVQFDRPGDFRGAPPKYYLMQMQEIPSPATPIAIDPNTPISMDALKAMASKPVYWNDVYKGLDSAAVTLGRPVIRPAKGYKFRVKAVNTIGSSDFSPESTISTEVAPPDAPSDLTATKVDTTSMVLQWSKPAGNGAEIRKYKVKMAKLTDVEMYHNYTNSNSSDMVEIGEDDNDNGGDGDELQQSRKRRRNVMLQTSVLISRGASATGTGRNSKRDRTFALIADQDDEDDEVDTNVRPGSTPGVGVKSRTPCDAIHPNVYDRETPKKFLTPDVVPGSQPVYPVIPGKETVDLLCPPGDYRCNKTGWDFGETSNHSSEMILPESKGATASGNVGVDGFEVIYEGELNETSVIGLVSGEFYVFSAQAISELGASPDSVYTTIQAKPAVPHRLGPTATDTKGRNHLAVSWQVARERGHAVTGYVVQISDHTDAYGKDVWENTCLADWPMSKAMGTEVVNFTSRRDVRAEEGYSARKIQYDPQGVPMDFCRPRPTTTFPNASLDDMRYRHLGCCVDSLEPETAYKFRVASMCSIGLSEWSPSAEARTRGSPPLIPLPPRLTAATETTLSLEWDTPPAQSSDKLEMAVRVQLAKSLAGNPEEVWSGTNQSCNVTDLDSGHIYWLRIRAENHNGVSPWSEYLKVTTCTDGVSSCTGVVPVLPEMEVDEEDPAESEVMLAQLAFDATLRQRVASNPSLVDRWHTTPLTPNTHPHSHTHSIHRNHK